MMMYIQTKSKFKSIMGNAIMLSDSRMVMVNNNNNRKEGLMKI